MKNDTASPAGPSRATSAIFSLLASVGLLVAISIADFLTGYEMGVSFFYLIPIGVISWVNGGWAGVASAVVASAVWGYVDHATGHVYSRAFYLYWNAGMRLLAFSSIAVVLSALHRALREARILARTDHLTGAVNSGSFLTVVQSEIERTRRYGRPFSLAYLDLDNFKMVNDTLGHAVGDDLLRVVVVVVREQLRTSDTVARLGGDEFAFLLPETDQEAAQAVIAKVQGSLEAKVRERNWPVTMSIGCVTVGPTGAAAEELLHQADTLMYRAKMGGKNAARFARAGEGPGAARRS
ncbi:MAG TPA: GGDEF domain-containing protein [Spirochaetia bacterium]